MPRCGAIIRREPKGGVPRLALFAISDLHLSTAADTDKSMEVFGKKWAGYTERLEKNWRAVVSSGDTVVIPGDVSWSISLAGTRSDFTFLHSLPGKKILGKGNHDFWWSTETKMNAYLSELGFDDIRFLHNNAIFCEGKIVCGTRGWFGEADEGAHGDFEKLVNREATRLKLSLDAAKKLEEEHPGAPKIAFFHFPPVWNDQVFRPFVDLLHEAGITECCFGHIHGIYTVPATTVFEGINFRFISADYLDFLPRLL